VSNSQEQLIPVLVTTERSIYFGFARKKRANKNNKIRLFRAKHVYYYAARNDGQGGTWALASLGPAPGSKVSPEVSEVLICDVKHVAVCTDEAVKTFAAVRWG